MSSTADSDDRLARARAVLQSIGAQARTSNRTRVVELTGALDEVGRGQLQGADRQRAVDTAHQLVGSAGTFGYRRASALAREVELFLRHEGEPEPGELAAALRALALVEQDLSGDPEE